jgi:hypothetical protein
MVGGGLRFRSRRQVMPRTDFLPCTKCFKKFPVNPALSGWRATRSENGGWNNYCCAFSAGNTPVPFVGE